MINYGNGKKKLLTYFEHAGGVLRLTLVNPERRNVLSKDMLSSLSIALDNAANEDTVRVIILSAEGPVFCAGHDLIEISRARENRDRGREFFVQLMTMCSEVMLKIQNCPKPVIAEIDGVATAAGCQLVASCDELARGACKSRR